MPVLDDVTLHSHCEMCQKPITHGDRLCGTVECKKKFDDAVRAKKRGMYMFVGLILILLLISTLGRGYL